MQRLRVAALHADMRLRLLRARELCLLGDYANGVPEFRRVLQDIKRQCAFSPAPDVRQFLLDLQAEYALLVQYERTLKDLSAVGRTMQHAARRRWNDRPVAAAPRPEAQPSPPRAEATTREKRVPTWARKPDVPRASKAPPKPSRKVSPVGGTTKKAVARDKENNSRNVVTRARKASAAAAAAPSTMKSTALMALTRHQTSKPRGKGVNADPVKPPASRRTSVSTSDDGDTIAGKTKYSDIAREGGWADQELIESIEREILDHGERISFHDIAGHDHTKQLLQEAIMLPQIAPHLFRDGLLKHCSGILMFGPPGTGKTLLAKALANECGLTFFNVSASTLSSKYRGDSEKLVRILFDMARYYAPVKTELLVQISGIPSGECESAHVMLLAATNLPWELDEAMRRRLTKRVYIPLPNADARRDLFRLNLAKVELAKDVQVEDLVRKTEGYSGDDIANVCETAKRMPVKRLYTPEVLAELSRRMATAGAGVESLPIANEQLVVTSNDFALALSNVSKSVSQDQLRRFREWEIEFGSK
ncbi:hypothetical protein P43SY_010312 [Pythium insidiosum]|uniref:AAA+ ATPase domain-containing protein n=1 Tax=Pythium insidiosum TaxID=114742 RepID=A0AAD5M4J3_PYTIN|nr:hypothetical protein P43SY_010312 [Pythium insidiosum]